MLSICGQVLWRWWFLGFRSEPGPLSRQPARMIEKFKNWNKSTFDTTIKQHHLLAHSQKKWTFSLSPCPLPALAMSSVQSYSDPGACGNISMFAFSHSTSDLLLGKSCVFVQTWIKQWWLVSFKWKFRWWGTFRCWVLQQETQVLSSLYPLSCSRLGYSRCCCSIVTPLIFLQQRTQKITWSSCS